MTRIALIPSILLSAYLVAGDSTVVDVEVPRRVKELGADSFEIRELAQKKLIELGPDALPILDRVGKSADAEVAFRLVRVRSGILLEDARRHDREWAASDGYALLGQRAKPAEALPFKPAPKPEQVVKGREEDRLGCLEWLASVQSEDGHWDSAKFGAEQNADIEQTALALFAFLGAGHTEKVGEHKEVVRNAVAWLKKQQREDGAFVMKGKAVEGITHALAAAAMCEATGMARVPDTVACAQRATDYSCEHQCGEGTDRGGFGRSFKSLSPDTMTTAFFTIHLKSAKVAGLTVPHAAFEGAIRFLDKVEDKEKHLFKNVPDGEVSATASCMALVSRQFLGFKKEELTPWVEATLKEFKGKIDGERPDPLCAWFMSLALFQQGGPLWKNWNEPLRKASTEAQLKEGLNAGSWEPSGDRKGIGRVGTTALMALSLEIYYRYKQLQPDQ